VYLDGKEVAHNYDSMESWTVPVDLVAGKEYDFKFETSNRRSGRIQGQVYWKTPEIHAREAVVDASQREDEKRLSAGRKFVDRFLDGR
jgi:hypothetical protein